MEVASVGALEVGDDKQRMLQQLAEGCGSELSQGEKDMFYNLLLTYADVLASSTSDIGRTDRS